MHDIYFSTFKLGSSQGGSPAIEEVLPLLEKWSFGSERNIDKPDDYERFCPGQGFEFRGGTKVETQYYEGENGRAYALRLRHPDSEVEEKEWRTEIVLSEKSDDGKLLTRASVGLLTGHTGPALTPEREVVSRPNIVEDLVREHGAYETLPLQVKPRKLSVRDVSTFLKLLTYPHRTFPVVWITPRNSDGSFPADPKLIAERLVGVAHVIASEKEHVSRRVGDHLPRRLNCFDGATRIYWPGFSTDDNPYRHQLWFPDQIKEIEDRRQRGFRIELLEEIAEVTTNRIVSGTVRWSDVRKLRSREKLKELREQGDSDEALELAEQMIDNLGEENESLEEQLDETQDALEIAQDQREYWRDQYLSEASGNGQEREKVEEDPPPVSLSEAVEKVLDRYGPEPEKPDLDNLASEATTLWIPNSVRREVENSFKDPASAYDALEWIATTFHHAKTGKESCRDFDKSCRGASGFWYEAHQGETTIGKYPNDYKIQWKDGKRKLKRHVGNGSGKDPRHTLRIAFFYDDEEEVVVVGYIGQHQQTDAS